MLGILKQTMVTGRDLEITEEMQATGIQGETNFILIDRQDLLRTMFDEVSQIADLKLCLEVQFYGEVIKSSMKRKG